MRASPLVDTEKRQGGAVRCAASRLPQLCEVYRWRLALCCRRALCHAQTQYNTIISAKWRSLTTKGAWPGAHEKLMRKWCVAGRCCCEESSDESKRLPRNINCVRTVVSPSLDESSASVSGTVVTKPKQEWETVKATKANRRAVENSIVASRVFIRDTSVVVAHAATPAANLAVATWC
jgi:hypothetical protein